MRSFDLVIYCFAYPHRMFEAKCWDISWEASKESHPANVFNSIQFRQTGFNNRLKRKLITLSRSAQIYGPGRKITSKSSSTAKSMKRSRSAIPSQLNTFGFGLCKDHSTYVVTAFNPAARIVRSFCRHVSGNARK